MAAAIVSFGVAALVVSVIKHLGGYTSLPAARPAGCPGRLSRHHLVVTVEGIFILYGASFAGLSPGVAVAIAVVHLAGVALALWGVCRAFRRFFSASDLIVPVMATGIVINLAAYMFSVIPVTWFDTREIAAVLPFGAVLAGRLLAGPLARAWLRPVLAGVLACYAFALGYGVAQPARLRQRAAGRRVARGPPPEHRARHLRRVEPHHARQRRPRRGQDGDVVAIRCRPPRLRIEGVLV